ncbi:MAG: DUF6804 family protein [Terriglobales bacterium]
MPGTTGEPWDLKGTKSMLTRVIKWSAIAVLIGGAFLRSVQDYRLLLQFVVAAAAVVVLTQAATMRRFVWMALFLVVAGLFNPVVPVPFSNYYFAIASTFAVFLFFFSLELLTPKPRLSMASITDRI